MPSEDATTGGKPGEGGMPEQVATAQQTQPDGAGGKPGDGGKPEQAEDTTALREALRKEREGRTAAEQRLKAIQDKDLPEAERTKRERDQAVTERDDWKTKYLKTSVGLEAAALGFANPRIAYAMLSELGLLEVDRDGIPINVESGLKKLLRDNPGMATSTARATGSAEGGVRGGSSSGGNDMNSLIRRAAGRGA